MIAAPEFEVEDAVDTEVRYMDHRGRPVVLNFWAVWCPYWVQELSAFQAAYEKYGDSIDFMMIDLADGRSETVETGRAFIEEQGYTFPVYEDTNGRASRGHTAWNIPLTVWIDSKGKVFRSHVGILDETTLPIDLENLLSHEEKLG